MEANLPIKNLIRLNLHLAAGISTFVFLFLISNKSIDHPVLNSILTLLIISLIGFANTAIVVVAAKNFKIKSVMFNAFRYSFTYLASLFAYLFVWPLLATLLHSTPPNFHETFFTFIVASALITTLTIISQNFILLQHEKAQADREFSKLKIAQAEAATLLLKQQIHPHFLFNALNTVKSLYGQDTDAGDSYLVHLANFLRASIFTHTEKVSPLEDEFSLLEDYVEMQKIRFGTALSCTITIPENSLNSYYLPSFSLQPLLENAIKHNELTEEIPLEVSIYQQNDRIIVTNKLQKKTIRELSTKNGLANLAERYRLLSDDEVIIKEDNHKFSVSIKLLANEYSNH